MMSLLSGYPSTYLYLVLQLGYSVHINIVLLVDKPVVFIVIILPQLARCMFACIPSRKKDEDTQSSTAVSYRTSYLGV